jgi:hypothetical protein
MATDSNVNESSFFNLLPPWFGFGHRFLFGVEAVIVEADAPADDRTRLMLR